MRTAAARAASLLASVLVAATLSPVGAAPAQAVPVPEAQRLVPDSWVVVPDPMNPRTGLFSALFTAKRPDGQPITTAMTARFSAYSCGRLVAQSYQARDAVLGAMAVGDPYGPFDHGRIVGRDLTLVLDITEPGYDTYQVTQTVDLVTERGMTGVPACDALDPVDPHWEWPTIVSTWSVKKGPQRARIGKKLVVTSPKLTGGEGWAGCTWKVNGRRIVSMTTIPRGACGALTVKPAYRGKKISVVVKVTDYSEHSTDRVRTLSYGRAR